MSLNDRACKRRIQSPAVQRQAFRRKIGNAPEQLAKIECKATLPQVDGTAASGNLER